MYHAKARNHPVEVDLGFLKSIFTQDEFAKNLLSYLHVYNIANFKFLFVL